MYTDADRDRPAQPVVATLPRPGWRSSPEMRYPNAYVWLVFLSALDVILTKVILSMGGREVNPAAAFIIMHWGFAGATIFKFCMVTLAIILCESVGRLRDRTGALLSRAMVLIALIPIPWSMMLIAAASYQIDLAMFQPRLTAVGIAGVILLGALGRTALQASNRAD